MLEPASTLDAPNRIVERQQTDGHSQPDPLRVLRRRGGNDQGRGHDREFGEKVQLRQPGRIEAKMIAMLDLGQRIAIAFLVGLPRSTGQLKKNPNFIDHAPLDGSDAAPRGIETTSILVSAWY